MIDTCNVDFTMPIASTDTTVPSTILAIKGVMKIVPTVVAVVIITERATSPLAMYVHKLEAWPPLMEPTSTQPARNGGGRFSALAMKYASAGIMA